MLYLLLKPMLNLFMLVPSLHLMVIKLLQITLQDQGLNFVKIIAKK